jgi:hypothetical protein
MEPPRPFRDEPCRETSGAVMDDFIRPVIGFVLGLLAENAGEWAVHRYILHGLGRKPGSLWHYHWAEHHAAARRQGMLDPDYRGWPFAWNTQGKEALLILLIAASHLPLLGFAPAYVTGVYVGMAGYYLLHRKAHLDPAWARRHLPWHRDHHLGDEPDANWCTTWPGCDWLMGTRAKPPKEAGDRPG